MIFYTDRLMTYPFIFYADWPIRDPDTKGIAIGPIVVIRPECKDNIGLREHELTHVKQWFFTLGLHSFLYLFSKQYRLYAEVEAYKVQLRFSPGKEAIYAKFIAEDYGLNISQEKALEMLGDRTS